MGACGLPHNPTFTNGFEVGTKYFSSPMVCEKCPLNPKNKKETNQ